MVCGGGTPGGDFQVQANLQTLVSVVDWGMDLQMAVDSPRWVNLGAGELVLESRYPASLREELAARGHSLHVAAAWDGTLQKAQVIANTAEGGWAATSDLRGEGLALDSLSLGAGPAGGESGSLDQRGPHGESLLRAADGQPDSGLSRNGASTASWKTGTPGILPGLIDLVA